MNDLRERHLRGRLQWSTTRRLSQIHLSQLVLENASLFTLEGLEGRGLRTVIRFFGWPVTHQNLDESPRNPKQKIYQGKKNLLYETLPCLTYHLTRGTHDSVPLYFTGKVRPTCPQIDRREVNWRGGRKLMFNPLSCPVPTGNGSGWGSKLNLSQGIWPPPGHLKCWTMSTWSRKIWHYGIADRFDLRGLEIFLNRFAYKFSLYALHKGSL